jgi:integrase
MARGAVSKRCGCVDDNGRQLGAQCPRLKRPSGGWSSDHGTWAYSVRVDGKLQRRAGFNTKDEAQAALDRVKARGVVGGDHITVAQFLDEWINAKKAKPNTLSQYRRYVDTFTEHLGGLKLSALRPAHITAMLDEHAPVSAQRMRAVLRSALSDAMRQELVVVNAAALTRNPAPSRAPKPLVWTKAREAQWRTDPDYRPSSSMVWRVDHVQRFLSAVEDHPLYAAWFLIAHTGARRAEICGLQWHDVDRKAMTISIERQVISTRDGIIIDSPKTEAGNRTLAITRSTLNVLIRHRKRQMELWGVTAKELPAWLFTKPDSTMLDPGYLTKSFNRCVRDAKLPPVRLHDLRHTAASLMLAAGVDMKTVSDTLGHSGITVTANIYASVYDDAHTAAADAMSRLIAGQ